MGKTEVVQRTATPTGRGQTHHTNYILYVYSKVSKKKEIYPVVVDSVACRAQQLNL